MTNPRVFPADWSRNEAEACGCPDCRYLIDWVDRSDIPGAGETRKATRRAREAQRE